MGTLNVAITTAKNEDTLVRDYERSLSAKYPTVQAISQLLQSILSGNEGGGPPTVDVAVLEAETAASGTFTLNTVIATDAISINGVTFTAVASGAGANQFNVGADDTATAANLAAAINASVTALVAGYVEATSEEEVVTVTSLFPGLAGNQTLIASADSTIVASGSRLTAGAADPNAKSYTF